MAGAGKKGPWGTVRDTKQDMGVATRFTKITVHHRPGIVVAGLKFHYEHNGVVQSSKQWGSTGNDLGEITFEKDEILKSIKGYTGNYGSIHGIITGLTFSTSKRDYSYGASSGTAFSSPQDKENMIVGFYGSSGGAINSIGVYIAPIPNKLDECVKAREELEKRVTELIKKNDALAAELADCRACCDNTKPPEKEPIKISAWVIQSHAGEVQYHWINSKGNDYASVKAPVDKSVPGDLIDVWDFQTNNRLMDITAKYESPDLKVGTKYQLVMIVLLKKDATGWRLPLNVLLPDGDDTSLQIPSDLPRDSWQPVVIGNFTVVKEGLIEFKIHDYKSAQLKDDFLLRGFELRPL